MDQVSSSEKKFLGIVVQKGLTKFNFIALFLATFFVGFLMITPTVLIPRFLIEIIEIKEENLGRINSTLANIDQILAILLFGYIGALSDRKGRKILLVLGLLGSGISYFLFATPKLIGNFLNLEPLIFVYLFRIFLSLSFTFAMPQTMTMIADYTEIHTRGKGIALSVIMMGAGIMAAFKVSGMLQEKVGLINVILFSGLISILASLFAKTSLKDYMPHSEHKKETKGNWKKVFQTIKNSPKLKLCMAANFTQSAERMVLGIFLFSWMVKVASEFGLTRAQATTHGGKVLALSILFAFVGNPVWGVVIDKWGRMPAIIGGLLVEGLAFVWIGIIKNPFELNMWFATILSGLGAGGIAIGARTLTTDLAPKNMLGAIFGVFNSIGMIGGFVFVFVGGFIFDYLSYSVPLIVVGVFDLLILLYSIYVFLKNRNTKDGHEIS